jgi:Replication initiator protein, pSAM2
MLGFGGHFLTKSRYYSVTFRLLREARATWQRIQTAGPGQDSPAEAPIVLVVNFLEFVGAGWHNAGDALLANASAARAREQRQAAREALAE